MKKTLVILLISLALLAGCESRKESYVRIKSTCDELNLRYYATTLWYSGKCLAEDNYCEILCSDLFDESTDKWGTDNADGESLEVLYKCFNGCLATT